MSRPYLLGMTFVAALLLSGRPGAVLAQESDVIRGRVLDADSLPVEGARITVTSVVTRVARNTRSDRNGRFTVIFPGDAGHYVVSVSQVGFLLKSFELKRTADQAILVADATLTRPQLEAVIVAAEARGTIARGTGALDISGTDDLINAGGLPPSMLGDLAAMAASIPGTLLVPGADGAADGFSVLGLDPNDNSITLNGMTFDSGLLPRDAAFAASLATNPYDVSRGGFSGGQLSIRSLGGSNTIVRGMSLNVLAPQLSWTDRASRALGSENTLLSLSGRASGPIKSNSLYYNVAWEGSRNSNPLQTLLNTSSVGLRSNGVAFDSVGRLLGVLDDLGIPVQSVAVGNHRVNDRAAILGSFDLVPPGSSKGSAYHLTVNTSLNRSSPASAQGGWSSLPAFLGENEGASVSVQGRHSAYLTFLLTETSVGVSGSWSNSSPFARMPGGRVRVNSDFEDGTNGVRDLFFGGNQAQNSSTSSRGASLSNSLSWFSSDNKHRLRLTTEVNYRESLSEQANNFLGTFTFNSIADLADGLPASYARQLSVRASESSQITGALSLGDAFRVNPDLQLQYGVRMDGGSYFIKPQYNQAVMDAFGSRNDFVPSRVYLSPRIGFAWTLGTAQQLSAFDGAVRGPRSVVRGGIAVQQSGLGSISQVTNNTGLPSAIQSLNCVGAAAPVPDWELFQSDPATIPSECADGTAGTVFSNSSPGVTLYARDYRAPRSVRSNLSWQGTILDARFNLNVSGTHSLNLNRSSVVDLNFDPTVRFTLDHEGGRPVFVQPTSIVERTGAIASRDARRTQSFSRVNELRSDLRSEAVQLQLRLNPRPARPTNFSWGTAYTWQDVRELQRGFSSTAGNPLDLYWSRGAANARHQISYSFSYTLLRFISIGWSGTFYSGRPFTPTIAGDVNGDGASNDRAFIFDPATTLDGDLAAGMQKLLSTTSRDARECLMRQLGRLAARNSCDGRWTMSGDLTIRMDAARLRLPARTRVDFSIANPLGGLDLLINGSSNLKGWGQGNQLGVDQTLLYVRGFDALTNTFRYEVNQRFGAPRQSQIRLLNPVRVTMLVRMDVGPVRERQDLMRTMGYGRTISGSVIEGGSVMPASEYRSMGNWSIPNPVISLLRLQDSLKLNYVQADSIAKLNRKFSIQLDSIWQVAGMYLEAVPREFDKEAAWQRYLSARHAAIDLMAVIGPAIRGILTPAQLRKLPTNVLNTMDTRYLNAVRNGSGTYVGAPALVTGGIYY